MEDKDIEAMKEWFMTYGWAVIICVIVFSGLYALGVFDPETWTSSGECMRECVRTCEGAVKFVR